METMDNIFTVIDFLVGLWMVTMLLIPGANMIKWLAPGILTITLVIQMVSSYSETKMAIITILGWF